MYSHPPPPRSPNQPNDDRFILYTVMHNTFDLTTFDEEEKERSFPLRILLQPHVPSYLIRLIILLGTRFQGPPVSAFILSVNLKFWFIFTSLLSEKAQRKMKQVPNCMLAVILGP